VLIRRVLPAIAAIAAIAAATAEGQTGPAQIRITDVQTSYTYVRTANGRPTGAVEFVKQQLYHPSVPSKPIGRATMTCTYFDQSMRTGSGT